MATAKKPPVLDGIWGIVDQVVAAGAKRVILYGPPGTGKSYYGLTYGVGTGGSYRLICAEDMTAADVTGLWQPSAAGKWHWREGAGIHAWRGDDGFGGRLVIDEIDKAGGDVMSTLLAITDTPESAVWENPETGESIRPGPNFSVVMTTNIEKFDDLPTALVDRFPVIFRINVPHPAGVERLTNPQMRTMAEESADLDSQRRISLRAWYEYQTLTANGLEPKLAAEVVFRHNARSISEALLIGDAKAERATS